MIEKKTLFITKIQFQLGSSIKYIKKIRNNVKHLRVQQKIEKTNNKIQHMIITVANKTKNKTKTKHKKETAQ